MTATHIDIPVKGQRYAIVGSYALGTRYAKDIDVICALEDITIETQGDEFIRTATHNGRRFEFLLTNNQESLKTMLTMYKAGELRIEEVCYILKAGHAHIAMRNQETWEKHRIDLEILHKIVTPLAGFAGFVLEIEPLVKLHTKCTDERIKQKTPKLKGVTKEKFFDDYVKKYVVHDDIHKAVAYQEKPGYEYMQRDATVECHKDLWNQMTDDQKLYCVVEEAMVIALERHIIPGIMENKVVKPPFLAFKWALYRICTTLTSGWFRQYANKNYFKALNMFDEERLNQALIKLGIKK
jgi:hypothetical protein